MRSVKMVFDSDSDFDAGEETPLCQNEELMDDESENGSESSDDDQTSVNGSDSENEDDSHESPKRRITAEKYDQIKELEELCSGTSFDGLNWNIEAGNAITFSSDWREKLRIAIKIGEILKPYRKTLQTLVTLYLGVHLLSTDSEAEELLDPESKIFQEFWTPQAAVITCLMQGGKTRRAIFMRGYFLANVLDKHAVVFANSQRTSYIDMKSALERLNTEFANIIPPRLYGKTRNKYIPEAPFLFTKLNETNNWDGIWNKHWAQAHFNIRLSTNLNANTLEDAFDKMRKRKSAKLGIDCKATSYQLYLNRQRGFTPANSFLILDESHETETSSKFAVTMRNEIKEWGKNVTLVTATTQAHLGGSASHMKQIHIIPKAGYYLHGVDPSNPTEDNLHHHIYSVHYKTLETDELQRRKKVPFPNASFKYEIDERYISELNSVCKEKRSHLQIILNDYNGLVSHYDRNGSSVNIGHANIALWCSRNAQEWRKTAKKQPSIAAVCVYNFSSLGTIYRLPRVFMNEKLFCRLKKMKKLNIREMIIPLIFSDNEQDSNLCYRPKILMDQIGETLSNIVYNCKRPLDSSKATPSDASCVFQHENGIYSIHLGRNFDIKATLSFIELLHKLRTVTFPSHDESKLAIRKRINGLNKNSVDYRKKPLKIFVVGKALMKQSVSVESKNREIQGTGLLYLHRAGPQIDYTRLLQMLGRIDHGLNESTFYRSAFNPENQLPATMRPVLAVSKELRKIVLGMPKAMSSTIQDDDLDKSLRDIAESVENFGDGATHLLMGGRFLEHVNARYQEIAEICGLEFIKKLGLQTGGMSLLNERIFNRARGDSKVLKQLQNSVPYKETDGFKGTTLQYLREWLDLADVGTTTSNKAQTILHEFIHQIKSERPMNRKRGRCSVSDSVDRKRQKQEKEKELQKELVKSVVEFLSEKKTWGSGKRTKLSEVDSLCKVFPTKDVEAIDDIKLCIREKDSIVKRACCAIKSEDPHFIAGALQTKLNRLIKRRSSSSSSSEGERM